MEAIPTCDKLQDKCVYYKLNAQLYPVCTLQPHSCLLVTKYFDCPVVKTTDFARLDLRPRVEYRLGSQSQADACSAPLSEVPHFGSLSKGKGGTFSFSVKSDSCLQSSYE